jgi:hypothetical protein
MATSESSIEVWWEAVPLRTKVTGYEIFYSMTEVEDLTKWQRKTVGLTTSAELVNIKSNSFSSEKIFGQTFIVTDKTLFQTNRQKNIRQKINTMELKP